jgi:hypothetical protein
MQEKSLVKKNILQYIDRKGISRYNFYKETGITRGILDQNNGMSEENIAKFLVCFKDVNPEWLLIGKGKMLKSSEAAAPAKTKSHPAPAADYKEKYISRLEEVVDVLRTQVSEQCLQVKDQRVIINEFIGGRLLHKNS